MIVRPPRLTLFPSTPLSRSIKRHTTCFIAHSDPAFLINTQPDMLTKARNRLVYGVVQGLPNQMDQTRSGGRTNVHARSVPKDRKSTRLNSSHLVISYAVFCL